MRRKLYVLPHADKFPAYGIVQQILEIFAADAADTVGGCVLIRIFCQGDYMNICITVVELINDWNKFNAFVIDLLGVFLVI